MAEAEAVSSGCSCRITFSVHFHCCFSFRIMLHLSRPTSGLFNV
jgi:hypothetical protein